MKVLKERVKVEELNGDVNYVTRLGGRTVTNFREIYFFLSEKVLSNSKNEQNQGL